VDRRRLDRRRGDQRQQVRELRELLGRRPHRLVDLAPHVGELHRLARRGQRPALQQLVDVAPVTAVGRHAPRRGVRMLEQAQLLEPRQLGAHCRRAPRHVVPVGEPARADRMVEVGVALDDLVEEELLASRYLHSLNCD
jgi:predicted transcriptional regulator